MITVGAHLSIEGGYSRALQRIAAIGGNVLQIFSASPKAWNFAKVSDETYEQFKADKKKLEIDPVYFHASYLLNLGDGARIGALSTSLLTHELKIASRMGIKGSIIHLGSYKDNGNQHATLIANIAKVLEKIPDDVLFIIENSGTRKIGLKIDEIAKIVKDMKDSRVRVCLDTCHLHAAGYNLKDKDSFEAFLADFERTIGLKKLELWHVNDSRDPFGSLRDRHENLGEGSAGPEVFINLTHHPETKNLPFIIETPGFDGLGPDKKNIDILKKFAQ